MYDDRGLPCFPRYDDKVRTRSAQEEFCPHANDWRYLPTASTTAPPCLIYEGRRKLACPSGKEKPCAFYVMARCVGRSQEESFTNRAIPTEDL